MQKYLEKAEMLVQALPYIQKFNGKTIVVKYGGNAMIDEDLKHSVIQDIVLLSYVGINIVVVHGGGPEITEMLKKIQKNPDLSTVCVIRIRRRWISYSRYSAEK